MKYSRVFLVAGIVVLGACGQPTTTEQASGSADSVVIETAATVPPSLPGGLKENGSPSCAPGREEPGPPPGGFTEEWIETAYAKLTPVSDGEGCVAGWVRTSELYPDYSDVNTPEEMKNAADVSALGIEVLDEGGNVIGRLVPDQGLVLNEK